jgi:hypothetical protein
MKRISQTALICQCYKFELVSIVKSIITLSFNWNFYAISIFLYKIDLQMTATCLCEFFKIKKQLNLTIKTKAPSLKNILTLIFTLKQFFLFSTIHYCFWQLHIAYLTPWRGFETGTLLFTQCKCIREFQNRTLDRARRFKPRPKSWREAFKGTFFVRNRFFEEPTKKS